MKLDSPLLNKLGGLLGAAALRSLMSTLDYKAVYYDRATDPSSPECRGQKIYIFWHEYMLFPLYMRGHCNISVLASWHRDAEIVSHAAYHLGYGLVRGSTNRGGVAALREMLQKSRNMHMGITPDGPRGPRRRLAPGSIYLASKLGMPLVLMGFAYDRPWRVKKAWDQFAIPRPFSRARAISSGDVYVPPNLDREGLEHFRQRVEQLMKRLTAEAEAWAASGTRKIGQSNAQRRAAPLHSQRDNTPISLTAPQLTGPHWPAAARQKQAADSIR